MRQDRYQSFVDVLTDAWCPNDLAHKAAEIATKFYPDHTLLGATEEEIQVLRQAKAYLEEFDQEEE